MLIALDFESEAIEPRPKYPPVPVGLAVMEDGDTGVYNAWGHPEGNNCKKEDVADMLRVMLPDPCNWFVFHNASFDCDIIKTHFKLEVPWKRVDDTMLMAFLLDPYGELGLKPLAEIHLGEPPVEQDMVREWLVRHGKCNGNAKDWGAHIAKAPAGIVAPYAIGDVRKTLGLYKYMLPKLRAKGIIP
jgi:DNA polymerase I-like protein with 3'-5' exonuclease and polymerase domains